MRNYLSLIFFVSILDVAIQEQKVIPYVEGSFQKVPKQLTLNCKCGKPGAQLIRRVVGGTAVVPHEYPWIVAIYRKKTKDINCAGALLTDRHVLTVAHCFNMSSQNFRKMHVALGLHFKYDITIVQKRKIRAVIIHENYTSEDVDINDIAVVDLKKPIDLNEAVSPICLPLPMQDFSWRPAIVAGWGKTDKNYQEMAAELTEANIVIYTEAACKRSELNVGTLEFKGMLCGNAVDGQDTCEGDAGSPLMVFDGKKGKKANGILVGLSSWGIDCGLPEYPGVYTKVSYYVNWIRQKTTEGLYCES